MICQRILQIVKEQPLVEYWTALNCDWDISKELFVEPRFGRKQSSKRYAPKADGTMNEKEGEKLALVRFCQSMKDVIE